MIESACPSKKRVAVALSGGADSAAAASLLMKKGYHVSALTMIPALAPEEAKAVEQSARLIADALQIEHRVLDLSRDFDRLVVSPFVESYLRGSTPNPCVLCNRDVKFGLLMEEAFRLGCTFFATGHYARIRMSEDATPKLLMAKDERRDQTYVLWTLTGNSLQRLLFPVGDITGDEVESLIREEGIDRFTRAGSQDICFVSGGDYRGLLEERSPEAVKPGPILDTDGRLLGEHRGLAFYTVGQRRGLNLGTSEARYVIEILPEENALIVGGRERMKSTGFSVKGMNFVAGDPPASVFNCETVIRYHGDPIDTRVETRSNGNGLVHYLKPGTPAAPGQSAVFYRESECLGGALIAG